MTLREFCRQNRKAIDAAIREVCSNCQIQGDDDREDWVLNEESLYNWAQQEGVTDL